VDATGAQCEAIEVEPSINAPKGAGSRGTYNPATTLKRNDYHVSHGSEHFTIGEVVPAGLRYGVKRLFENTATDQFQVNRKAGSLNVNSLHTIALGNERLFKRRLEEEGVDSAVVILLDVSGSMFRANNYKDTLMASAVQAVYALLDTLNKAGVATAVVTFGSNCGLLKPFNMPVKKTVPLLRSLGNGGDTNDFFGLAYAHELLRGRPEARKVAFVLTDGDGNRNATREQARSGTALGITTVGIGIKHDVSDVYPINVRVNNVADLGSVAFTKLKLAA
jgi:cobalamin biosynthesis protein CobT